MAIETGAYVQDLAPANPPGSDQYKTTDDHLRLMKLWIKQSFDLMSGGMTTGGTSTALTLTTGHSGVLAYHDTELIAFALHTNIGASATLNRDGLGARTLKKKSGASWVDVAANDYLSGDILFTYYEGGDNTIRIIASSQLPANAFLPLTGGTLTGTLTITVTDEGIGTGAGLNIQHHSTTPANNDQAGFINFQARDSASNMDTFGQILVTQLDTTSTSEDGQLEIRTAVAGTLTTLLSLNATALTAERTFISTNGTNSVQLTGNDGGIELLKTTGSAYVDFKNNSGDDFDVRILQSGTGAVLDVNVSGTGVVAKINSTGVKSATTAKAWCYGGYSGGVPSANQAYNVASFTDIGTGQPRANLTNNVSGANGCATASAVSAGAAVHAAVVGLNAAYVELQLFDAGHGLADLSFFFQLFDGTV